eukprot:TRINITY_DN7802_c0_g1_i6.p1 TRINITY_DN7802_c0_g1~~TRINITY_DN7802_c0_g1_i6.p1  ORF type:complete len:835 (+),score=216.53 TRINITY_DN7802_c0_g1_i6:82-2505(+)
MAGKEPKGESQFMRQHKSTFIEYLHKESTQGQLTELINDGKFRFAVNLDELRRADASVVHSLLLDPAKYITMMSDCIKEIAEDIEVQDPAMKVKPKSRRYPYKETYEIAFEGNFGRNHITPRGLVATNLGQLVQVEGIVTRLSTVKSKLLVSVHYCEDCQEFSQHYYDDPYNLRENRTEKTLVTIPTKDYKGHPIRTEFGLCHYKDSQSLVLQEMPERTPPGQLPRSIEVILEKDLVNRTKPGDRIDVVGVYKTMPLKKSMVNGLFKTVLIATNVTHITEIENQNITEMDIKRIQDISKRKDVFELLSSSIAASIEGHKYVKQALLLQLLGGVEKILDSGTHLRGDINVLLVGDPSTGKSQMLRSIMNLATLSICTTGRGSTGVGLTAAVVSDKETGERHLEAGAMVLGDRGIVCIDEFDKMSDLDRVAIHEVMEQQTVTIAKAGIYTSLNARCSVLAAANPIYGEYINSIPLSKNIGLADSLLSRFDLLFITLDKKDPVKDREIARRVIINHRYKGNNDASVAGSYWTSEDVLIEPSIREDGGKETLPFEKQAGFFYAGRKKEVVTKMFLKKYISYAKRRSQPRLTNEAISYVSRCWSDMRARERVEKTLPITVRTLETLIRLATAHAKCRISDEVTVDDCKVIEKLVNYAVFRENPETSGVEPMEDIVLNAAKGGSKENSKQKEKAPNNKQKFREPGSRANDAVTKRHKPDLEEEAKGIASMNIETKIKQAEKEKKYIFKILTLLPNNEDNTLTPDIIWDRFMKQPKLERESLNIKSKENLITVLQLLDNDGCLTFTEEGTVALI